MAVPIRSHQSLHDPVRRAHRRALLWRVLRWASVVIVIVGILGFGGWWLWHHRPHTHVPVVQRTPIGIWCRQNACQYFDASGRPLAGGLVCTYAAGTTTAQATSTDDTGGTPNSNPVVLDAGEWGVFVPGAAQKCEAWLKWHEDGGG